MDTKSAHLQLHIRLCDSISSWELDVYGEMLKESKNLKVKTGRDAIALYLVNKHGWQLDHCRTITDSDLKILLADELKAWKMPKEIHSLCSPFLKWIQANPAP